MNQAEYIQNALRTESSDWAAISHRLDPMSLRLLHAGIGLTTEAGEFMDALKKRIFYGAKPNATNLAEELGDIFWYLAIAVDALGVDFEDIQARNIAKLAQRYPDKFTEAAAATRDLAAERAALEEKAQPAIRTADQVYHRPTGETWLVAYAEGGKVCPCGWPTTLAEESDCEMRRRGTAEERLTLLRKLAKISLGSDPRRLYAERTLEELEQARQSGAAFMAKRVQQAFVDGAKWAHVRPDKFLLEEQAASEARTRFIYLPTAGDIEFEKRITSGLCSDEDFARLFDEAILEPAFETTRLRFFKVQLVPMDQNEPHTVFLATRTDEDRPMLTATAVVMPPIDITVAMSTGADKVAWVDWIEVTSEYRRQGFGRELILGIEKHMGCNLLLEPGSELGKLFCTAMENISATAAEEAPAAVPGAEAAR